jgi:uncharacterized phage-associated protein
MVDVFDVAKFILEKQGPMTTMKLQKLVYYCQAWSLVWDEKPLFNEKIEAWASGPVVEELYQQHKGKFIIDDINKGDTSKLSIKQKTTINAVLRGYGKKSGQWLADLTHMENPWKDARKDYDPGTLCDEEITQPAMLEYYSSLTNCEPV